MHENIVDTAKILHEGAEGKSYFLNYPSVRSVPYTFPEQGIEVMPWNAYVDAAQYATYNAMRSLMDPETMPDTWKDAIEEAAKMAEAKGSAQPVDLVLGAYHAIDDNRKYARQLGIEPFNEDEWGSPDFRDAEAARTRINAVLADSYLRKYALEIASTRIPDRSPGWLDNSCLSQVILPGSRVLDVGCGTGNETYNLHEILPGSKIIGLDRQYFPKWYCWGEEDGDDMVRFIKGDANGGIPLADGSIDYITMYFVADHITLSGMKGVVAESLRVLKQGGLLLVAPQDVSFEDNGWRVFRKTVNSGEVNFQEVRFSELGV